MLVIDKFESFNHRRYSDPWVAVVDADLTPDFRRKVGKYTGAYKSGEAGELIILEPVEGQVYMYGQKDYRGGNTFSKYIVITDGEAVEIEKTELSQYF